MSNEVPDLHTRISDGEIQENIAATTSMAQLLLNKINADSKSNVDFLDFPGLELNGERVTVGRHNFPKSLRRTVERIVEDYGDITENSKMHPIVDERAYILFCAAVKEMEDRTLEQVTEEMILKWNDAIKNALRINFKVEFAMNHLKNNIVPAYIGRVERQEAESMALTISKLEVEFNAWRVEYGKICEQSMLYEDAIHKFTHMSLSSGLFKYQ